MRNIVETLSFINLNAITHYYYVGKTHGLMLNKLAIEIYKFNYKISELFICFAIQKYNSFFSL